MKKSTTKTTKKTTTKKKSGPGDGKKIAGGNTLGYTKDDVKAMLPKKKVYTMPRTRIADPDFLPPTYKGTTLRPSKKAPPASWKKTGSSKKK